MGLLLVASVLLLPVLLSRARPVAVSITDCNEVDLAEIEKLKPEGFQDEDLKAPILGWKDWEKFKALQAKQPEGPVKKGLLRALRIIAALLANDTKSSPNEKGNAHIGQRADIADFSDSGDNHATEARNFSRGTDKKENKNATTLIRENVLSDSLESYATRNDITEEMEESGSKNSDTEIPFNVPKKEGSSESRKESSDPPSEEECITIPSGEGIEKSVTCRARGTRNKNTERNLGPPSGREISRDEDDSPTTPMVSSVAWEQSTGSRTGLTSTFQPVADLAEHEDEYTIITTHTPTSPEMYQSTTEFYSKENEGNRSQHFGKTQQLEDSYDNSGRTENFVLPEVKEVNTQTYSENRIQNREYSESYSESTNLEESRATEHQEISSTPFFETTPSRVYESVTIEHQTESEIAARSSETLMQSSENDKFEDENENMPSTKNFVTQSDIAITKTETTTPFKTIFYEVGVANDTTETTTIRTSNDVNSPTNYVSQLISRELLSSTRPTLYTTDDSEFLSAISTIDSQNNTFKVKFYHSEYVTTLKELETSVYNAYDDSTYKETLTTDEASNPHKSIITAGNDGKSLVQDNIMSTFNEDISKTITITSSIKLKDTTPTYYGRDSSRPAQTEEIKSVDTHNNEPKSSVPFTSLEEIDSSKEIHLPSNDSDIAVEGVARSNKEYEKTTTHINLPSSVNSISTTWSNEGRSTEENNYYQSTLPYLEDPEEHLGGLEQNEESESTTFADLNNDIESAKSRVSSTVMRHTTESMENSPESTATPTMKVEKEIGDEAEGTSTMMPETLMSTTLEHLGGNIFTSLLPQDITTSNYLTSGNRNSNMESSKYSESSTTEWIDKNEYQPNYENNEYVLTEKETKLPSFPHVTLLSTSFPLLGSPLQTETIEPSQKYLESQTTQPASKATPNSVNTQVHINSSKESEGPELINELFETTPVQPDVFNHLEQENSILDTNEPDSRPPLPQSGSQITAEQTNFNKLNDSSGTERFSLEPLDRFGGALPTKVVLPEGDYIETSTRQYINRFTMLLPTTKSHHQLKPHLDFFKPFVRSAKSKNTGNMCVKVPHYEFNKHMWKTKRKV